MGDFLTSCYHKRGAGKKDGVSLLLQQGTCRQTALAFACVCCDPAAAGGDRYFTGQLLLWYRRMGALLCAKGRGTESRAVKESLERALRRVDEELLDYRTKMSGKCAGKGAEKGAGKDIEVSGILCGGDGFLLFHRGGQSIYQINTRFLRPNVKKIAGENTEVCGSGGCGEGQERFCIKQGILQPGAGVLLATASFCSNLTEEMLKGCMEMESLRTQRQLDKRLGELGREAEIRAKAAERGKGLGAALVVSLAEKGGGLRDGR
ncbi:hypothetical protein [Candidatus Acetatifactor stercoripullorum]|uniref:hypothetical protein n=1 Tax=Candidatus Acetatifactor stercoripullorum TaxID=2838414 RepID=UPI00298EB5A0|nr:hypothetical protein [Candidatus Acetatifactor stercoripullorum]